MAGIGREDYPELTLSEAADIVDKVGRQSVKTTTALAEVMGLKSSDSGYFYHRVSALTKYFGVLERSKGNVLLTPLGQRIAHPLSDQDRRQALAESANRVNLLRLLYQSLGSSFHDADFRTKLRDVTQATPAEIEKTAPFLERLYRDAIPYLTETATSPVSPTPTAGEVGGGAESTDSRLHRESDISLPLPHEPGYRTFQSDGVYLRIKKDRDALEEADAVIRAWLQRYRGPKEPPTSEEG